MWFKSKSYIKFLLRSFHLHGIHSPFVYHLSNHCFKGKNVVLPRLIDYLGIEQILLFGNSSEIMDIRVNPHITITAADEQNFDVRIASFLDQKMAFDILYFPAATENAIALFHQALPLAHNDSVFVFEKIHGSEEMETTWKRIKQTEKIHVSIDTFHWGFVFVREEQVKEDFAVRIRRGTNSR